MGNPPCGKFSQENYSGEDTLHWDSSMALEEEEVGANLFGCEYSPEPEGAIFP